VAFRFLRNRVADLEEAAERATAAAEDEAAATAAERATSTAEEAEDEAAATDLAADEPAAEEAATPELSRLVKPQPALKLPALDLAGYVPANSTSYRGTLRRWFSAWPQHPSGTVVAAALSWARLDDESASANGSPSQNLHQSQPPQLRDR